MSALEHDGQVAEQKSSVKLTRNAKGDCQVEVKVYEGVDAVELARIRALAISEYQALNAEFYWPGA